MIGRMAQHDKQIRTDRVQYAARQLAPIVVVALTLLVFAWWRYNSELSQAASIPPQNEQSSVLSPTPAAKTPTSQQVPAVTQTPAPVTNTHLQVNGQTIPVPANGTVEQTIQSPDGTSTVHFSTNSTSTGSNDSSVSTDIQIDSNSNSSSQVVTDDVH